MPKLPLRHSMVGRQLERWEGPTEGGLEDGMGLEDDGGRWDQFEANKRLFNVTSTFSEVCCVHLAHTKQQPNEKRPHARSSKPPQDLYSTKYDPKTSSITPAQAARIAAEIEREARSTSNPHLREERGLVVDDSQVDEEDKYSAVVRHPAGGEAGSSAGGGAKRAGAAAGSWRYVVLSNKGQQRAKHSAMGKEHSGLHMGNNAPWETLPQTVPILCLHIPFSVHACAHSTSHTHIPPAQPTGKWLVALPKLPPATQ